MEKEDKQEDTTERMIESEGAILILRKTYSIIGQAHYFGREAGVEDISFAQESFCRQAIPKVSGEQRVALIEYLADVPENLSTLEGEEARAITKNIYDILFPQQTQN